MKPGPQQNRVAFTFQWIVICLGGGVWLRNLIQLVTDLDPYAWLSLSLLTLATIVVSLKPVTFTTPGMKSGNQRQFSISLSDALTFLVLIVYGVAPAIVLSGIDGLIASRRTVKRWQSNVFTLAMIGLSILAAAYTYEFMMRLQGRAPYAGLGQKPLTLILPLLVATTAYFIVNSLLIAALIALRYRRSIWRQLIDNHLWTAVTYFPLAIFAVVLYFFIQKLGWVSVIGTLPVLSVLYFSYKQYNQKVEEKLRKIEEISGLNVATVRALALAIDARSGVSPGHAERVKIYVRGLARHFDLSDLELQALEAGAMLRDVGMLAVPDHILTKPGQLTPSEMEKMKMHTIVGAELLSQVNFPFPVVPIVRHHHERWDGMGYPDGLRGAEIPLTARILSVADCFDASRENRNHRQALTLEQAIARLRESAGTVFDPAVVDVFVQHLPDFEAEIAVWAQNYNAKQPQQSALYPTQQSAQSDVLTVGYTNTLEQISSAHREVVMLYELAQSIGSSLSLKDTLALLLKRTAEIVPSTTSVVFLKEKDDEPLKFTYGLGQHADLIQPDTTASGQDSISKVFQTQTALCNVLSPDDFVTLGISDAAAYRTALIVPLYKGTRTLGVFALYSDELAEYSSEHIRLVEAVAKLAGDAVANAIYYEETEETAYTDRLTGLPNMRAIVKAFQQESERSKKTNKPLTLLMMDLDGFKAINDTFGHKMGDAFLIEIAQRMKAQFRSSDFLGRYAGDEFIAILPNARARDIQDLLARIRRVVETCELRTADNRVAKGGISIGVAEAHGTDLTLEDVMAQADAAMYQDKSVRKQQRNQIDTRAQGAATRTT